MLVPINLTGGDYRHKAKLLTNQLTRNFWPQIQGTQKAKSPYMLQSFYGLKEWAAPSLLGTDRGCLENQDKFYRVLGTRLYEVDVNGVHTDLGFIPGSFRCILKAMGSQIIIVNGGGLVYVWDGSTLTQNTSVNLGTPKSVAVLNNQAVYDAGSGQGFDVSDVGTPSTINGLNNAQAESDPDGLELVYGYVETLYLMGKRTTELWWNSGQGNPPFDKIQGAVKNVGVGAIHSAAENPEFIFFLASDRQVHTLTGGASAVDTVISTPEMAKEIATYSKVDDAIGWTMLLEKQWFYVLTFPTQDITWVFPVGGEWFQWGSSLTGRIRANSYVNVFGKHLVTDYNSAKIYELDPETYTDAGETIVRTRRSASIHSELFGQPGKEFELNELKIFLEAGVGALSGQGSDPMIGVSFSKDGGRTFGTERLVKTGVLNNTRKEVILKNCGRYMDCVIQLRVSDPIYWAIFGASAEMEICI